MDEESNYYESTDTMIESSPEPALGMVERADRARGKLARLSSEVTWLLGLIEAGDLDRAERIINRVHDALSEF